MSYRLPSPYNRNLQFSTEPQFRNPAGTNPLPSPQNMPSPCWFGNRTIIPIKLTAGLSDADAEAFWSSPIFDLQPQLRGTLPSGARAVQGRTAPNAVPLWGGSTLHIQISNLKATADSQTNIKLQSLEFGHVSDPGSLVQVIATSDITGAIVQDTDSVILSFQPLGSGGNVRYWRLKLRFFRTEDTSPSSTPPTYVIDAGYY